MTNLSAQFKAYLTQKDLSSVSVKNYVSDVNKFLQHLPARNATHSVAGGRGESLPSSNDFQNYYNKIAQNNTPNQTLKRYQSSLKKFGQFLQDEYLLAKNPALTDTIDRSIARNAPTKEIDLEKMLDAYRKSLEKAANKPATIKNYLADTRQFLDFIADL